MRKFILFILLVNLHAASLLAQEMFSLDKAVDYAARHSPTLEMNDLDKADAEAQIKERLSVGLPKLNGTAGYTYNIQIPQQPVADFITPALYGVLFQEGLVEPFDLGEPATFPLGFGLNHTVEAGLSLQTLIFDGSYLYSIRAAREYRNYVDKQGEQTKYEIKSNVIKAYLPVLVAEKNKEILDKNIANLENSLKETKVIYENGFVEKLDVDRLELSLENLRTERKKIDQVITVTLNALKYQMGYPVDKEIGVEDDLDVLVAGLIAEKIDIEKEEDLSKRPEIAIIEEGDKLNDLNMKAIKAGYYPSLSGFAAHQQTLYRNKLFDADESDWIPATLIGLNLNVPIFDGFEKKAKLQRALVSQRKNQIQLAEFKRGVQLQVVNAKINFSNTQQTALNAKKTFELSERIYDTTKIKYREGVGSSVEVMQAEREMYTAQSNYINALYSLLVAKTDLEIALGN